MQDLLEIQNIQELQSVPALSTDGLTAVQDQGGKTFVASLLGKGMKLDQVYAGIATNLCRRILDLLLKRPRSYHQIEEIVDADENALTESLVKLFDGGWIALPDQNSLYSAHKPFVSQKARELRSILEGKLHTTLGSLPEYSPKLLSMQIRALKSPQRRTMLYRCATGNLANKELSEGPESLERIIEKFNEAEITVNGKLLLPALQHLGTYLRKLEAL
jgi:hypothetical protein